METCRIASATAIGHPWALCTCNLAELYCRVATAVDAGAAVRFA